MITVGLYGISDSPSFETPQFVHDHSITFMRNGKVLTTIMLERYTGVKHDQRLGKYITEILEAWIKPGEAVRFVSVNSFMGNVFASDDGNFTLEPLEEPSISNIITKARAIWHRNGSVYEFEAWVMCHEFAHIAAAMAFGVEIVDSALLVHIDGGASQSACSFWQVVNRQPILIHSSWDDLKTPVNNFNVGLMGKAILGLTDRDHLSMPGKLMGFSAYGQYDSEWYDFLVKRNFYLGDAWTHKTMIEDISLRTGGGIRELNTYQPFSQNLSACIQEHFKQNVVNTIRHFSYSTKAKTLVYSGGAALNIPTNACLEQCFGVGNVFIPPCPDDSGLSLGAACWVEYIHGNIIEYHEPFLNQFQLSSPKPHYDNIYEVAKAISQGKVVALCISGSETGPRALGHRSILGRPDNVDLKKIISEDIKKREWYRPVAPALLPHIADKALNGNAIDSKLSPYMLGHYEVKDSWVEKLQGVVHVDGTTRAQVVHNTPGNQFLYKLLEILDTEFNVPAVINTSFNQQGEPIVHSSQNAIDKLSTMNGIDMVVDNGSLHFA